MSDVYVFQGGDPVQMAYEAVKSVFLEDPSDLSVLLKVNTGFKGPAASGLCTHPEVVRGLIRFFRDQHVKKLYVGDNGGLRRLTLREGLRLCGYPDNIKFNVNEKEGFDLLGNTVVVPVIKAVAERLLDTMNG